MVVKTDKQIFKTLINSGLPINLALLVVAQSKHETAVHGIPYSSKQFLVNNNCFGYGYVKGNKFQLGSGGTHPEDSGRYAKYPTVENSVLDIAGYYKRRSGIFFKIKTTKDFANALKSQGYFTDSVNHYIFGLRHFYKNMKQILAVLFIMLSSYCFGQVKDTSNYYLVGKLGDFKLLFMAIKSPQDITPRQDSALVHWIESIRRKPEPTDSIKKTK